MATIKNAIKEMEALMKPEHIHRAKIKAENEIISLRLAQLREKMKVKQSDMHAFTQSAISKLEHRKDIKLSTLIEYLEDIGLGMEIRVFPKKGRKSSVGEMLLKV